MQFKVTFTESPTAEDIVAITNPLRDYNLQNAPAPNFQSLALLIRDTQDNIIGGLNGRSAYDWLFIDYLVVPSELRGQGIGRELMQRAEQIAVERNCIGIWLDSFSFQAVPFYEKIGYIRFGQIDDYPIGHTRYFLQKRLRLYPSTSA